MDIFRRATVSTSGAKNPLTAGAAERREWQYEDADASDRAEVPCDGVYRPSLRLGRGLAPSVLSHKH